MEPSSADDLLAVARVVRPHGLEGELSVVVLAPPVLDPADLLVGRRLFLRAPEGMAGPVLHGPVSPDAHGGNVAVRPVQGKSARPHQARWLVKLAGIDTLSDAKPLRGHDLCLPRAELPALPDGWYWEADLVGCRVIDERLGEIGTVAGLDTTAPQPQLLLRRPSGAIVSIPWVRAYMRRVDLDQNEIRLTLPGGFPGIAES
jgi:16S rRNA processing protein RimM